MVGNPRYDWFMKETARAIQIAVTAASEQQEKCRNGVSRNRSDKYCKQPCGCALVTQRPTNMLVYLRDGSAQIIAHAATLRWKLQIKRSISPSHSILAPGQPVPALTLYLHAPGRVATGVPIFLVTGMTRPEKSPRRERGSNPGLLL